MSAPLPKIWVVAWEYPDRSAFGLIRAFEDERKAAAFKKVLAEHGGGVKDYLLFNIEMEYGPRSLFEEIFGGTGKG